MFNILSIFNKKATSMSNVERSSIDQSCSINKKTPLEEYLSYYIKQKEPGYAVLVTGAWGVGKTYQVRKALPDSMSYYCSLYGLSKIEDVEELILSVAYPDSTKKINFAKSLDGAALKIPLVGEVGTGGVAAIIAKKLLERNIDNSKPIIFDDLERCTIETKQLLGLINRYVEHYKCNVVVIAHDEKMQGDFNESKEKIFGHTISVTPDIEGAVRKFIDVHADMSIYKHLQRYICDVEKIFNESNYSSLRLLRQTISDIGQIYSLLDEKYIEHTAAMQEFTRLFVAISLEYRGGPLKIDDLINRAQSFYMRRVGHGRNQDDAPAGYTIVDSVEKYHSVKLTSELIPDAVLKSILVDGYFVRDDINSSFANSQYFRRREDCQPWQTVIEFQTIEDEVVESAVRDMEEQISSGVPMHEGDLLHVIALRMMMSTAGAIEASIRVIADEAKEYINKLHDSGALTPRSARHYRYAPPLTAYRGIAFWVQEEYRDAFDEVKHHLIERQTDLYVAQSVAKIPDLLATLSGGREEFYNAICFVSGFESEYQDVPILAHISVEEFADAWLRAPKYNWHWIASALKERAGYAAREPQFERERAWHSSMITEMKRRANEYRGLARLRIVRAISIFDV